MVNPFRAFHDTAVGASHIKAGTVCQDYSLCAMRDSYRLAVVCDGHGGADYFRSDRGSRYAAEAFCECVDSPDFLNALSASRTEKEQNERITQLVKSVIAKWNSLVEQDMANAPFAEAEMAQVSEKAKKRYLTGEKIQSAYGTTLIGAVVTENFWLGIQIGDGKCVVVENDGIFSQPIPWDDACFLNVTTSICDENAVSEFRYAFSRTLPCAVFLGSDGVDDSFAGDEKLYDFYRVVLKSFAASDEPSAMKEFSEYLPKLSGKGSGDDVSVAMLLNTKYIKEHAEIFEKPDKVFLRIARDGNMGGDNPNDTYYQEAEIEAVPGIISLSDIDCDGFHEGCHEFEILSAEKDEVTLKIKEKTYTVRADSPATILQKSNETSYDGPRWTAEDTLEIRIK